MAYKHTRMEIVKEIIALYRQGNGINPFRALGFDG